jgi:hypothetical protein
MSLPSRRPAVMEINLFDDGYEMHTMAMAESPSNHDIFFSEPQVQWLSSLTAPTAPNLQIEIMGVSVCLEQDQKSQTSENFRIETAKPSTVGTGVIVWVNMNEPVLSLPPLLCFACFR